MMSLSVTYYSFTIDLKIFIQHEWQKEQKQTK